MLGNLPVFSNPYFFQIGNAKDVFTFNILVFLTAILPQECVFSNEISGNFTDFPNIKLRNTLVVFTHYILGFLNRKFTPRVHFFDSTRVTWTNKKCGT